jgi:hypothetical protein
VKRVNGVAGTFDTCDLYGCAFPSGEPLFKTAKLIECVMSTLEKHLCEPLKEHVKVKVMGLLGRGHGAPPEAVREQTDHTARRAQAVKAHRAQNRHTVQTRAPLKNNRSDAEVAAVRLALHRQQQVNVPLLHGGLVDGRTPLTIGKGSQTTIQRESRMP